MGFCQQRPLIKTRKLVNEGNVVGTYYGGLFQQDDATYYGGVDCQVGTTYTHARAVQSRQPLIFCGHLPVLMKHCRPLQPLGHGSTGVVFLAQLLCDTPDDHNRQTPPISDSADDHSYCPTPLVAIKAFSKARRGCLHRSHNEEQVLSKLTNHSAPHPFLPTLHSSFEDAEFRYLVLDYCAGGDLNSLRYTLPDKRFSCAAIRFYAAEIVLALEHLHQEGIVYRDLKPENILLSFNGHIMLTDFDLSAILPPKSNLSPLPEQASMERRSKSHKLQAAPSGGSHRVMPDASYGSMEADKGIARCHSFVGTDDYVAPEVIQSKGHEFAVDWWALGILLYEMVYGRAPFKGVSSRETFRNIIHKELELCGLSSPLRDLIIKLLVKEPHLRLGYRCGAAEIKAHPFFLGVQWEALQDVLRPPFIPDEPDVVGSTAPHKPFDLRAHLLEVECIRIEERARKKLARKLALE